MRIQWCVGCLCLLLLGLAAAVTVDAADTLKAIAVVQPAKAAATQPVNSNVTGTVTFTQSGDVVEFTADITGLEPNTSHGFHIHAKADLSDPQLAGAGGHFNPTSQPHGGPNAPHHHLGDLGNLVADASGHAMLTGEIHGVTLSPGATCIIGRSVIIHAKEDDLSSQPSGNSGSRVAGGVIEANP